MNKQRPSKSAAFSANSTKLPPPPNDAPPPIQPVQSATIPDSHQSPKRIVESNQPDAGEDGHDGKFELQQPQRRKRSNEPIKRRESKEKLRKSAAAPIEERNRGRGQPQQIDGMEDQLEELRRENNALKHKLEEQIRLNSVIVANPTKGSNWRMTDTAFALSSASTAAVANTIMEGSHFGSASSADKSGAIKTISDSLPLPSAVGPTSSSSLLLPSMTSSNCILQKSEPSAFSVICRGQKEEELIAPSIHQPLDLLNFYTPNFPLPSRLGDNILSQSEFVRLAAQLTPFSLFSMDSSSSQPSSGNNLMERHQQLFNELYGMPDQAAKFERLQSSSDRMAELSHPLTLETSTVEANYAGNSRAEFADSQHHFPINEVDIGGQEGPLDFSNKIRGVIRSKGNANANGNPFHHNQKREENNVQPKSVITSNIGPVNCELTMPQPPPPFQPSASQLLESTPKAAAGQTKVPFSSSHSISSPPLPIHFHHSAPNFCLNHSAPNFALCEDHKNQSVLEIATNSVHFPSSSLFPNLNGCLPPSSTTLFNNPFAQLFNRQQNIQKELDCTSSTENDGNKFDHLGRMLDSNRKNADHSPFADAKHQNCVERQNSPKRLGQKQKAENCSDKNAVFVAGPSTSSSSSMSMLGTLLAAPNKRHTSPTVPASRTELCSGLAAVEVVTSQVDLIDESRRRIVMLERAAEEKKHQNVPNRPQMEKNGSSDSEHSSTGGCGPSNSPTNSMDSSHSASPHHHHHQNSSGSSPSSSTLPGAGSTVTTICGSDLTRRGSSSPSGHSVFSGDDSLDDSIHNMRKEMKIAKVENGKKSTTEFDQNGENGHQSTGGHQKLRESFGSGMNLRVRLRTSEEMERYMDRRRRNNEAAKRCRANRRAVFEYRSRRAQMLEAENGELRQEMIKLNNELDQLKSIIATNAAAANRIVPTV